MRKTLKQCPFLELAVQMGKSKVHWASHQGVSKGGLQRGEGMFLGFKLGSLGSLFKTLHYSILFSATIQNI